jgi:vacuolar-type H+-ATPase subunit H
MYHTTGVGKLSESQKSKLRNGHPVRIKIGSGNTLNLTDAQIKKLQSAHKKGAAYTITFHPEQAEKHGEGFFGDIASKAKAFAKKQIISNKDLLNPIIGRARSYAKSGINSLSNKAKEKLEELADKVNEKIDKYTPEIEGEGVKRRRGRPKKGEGIIGDALKGLIGMSGLGVVKPKRLKKEGKGIMSSLLKAVAPAIIDAAAGAVKGKVEGMGWKKRRAVKPRKGRGGGALFPAGNYGPND